MLISIDWIKDFVEISSELSGKEIGEKLTLSTAEVEDVIIKGEYLEKIKIVQIKTLEPHPDADNLTLVSFQCSDDENDVARVVCGAKNLYKGMKVPYASIGTTLPGGLTLEPKKIRGIVSSGMLCSNEELEIPSDSEKSCGGLMDLPKDAPLGISMSEFLGVSKDILLDIDNKSLTHRPDLWGHYGFAREFAAIFDNQLKNPFDQNFEKELTKKFTSETSPISVKVEKNCAGLAYFGLSLKNVKITESPAWIKNKLEAVGLRPINNIVDISNYVMLELGIPLHIFDRDMIKGNSLFIKKLSSDEKFTTLDEIERDLKAGDTVICDAEETLVLAGIMGGLHSGVTDKTTNIFIEVANWKAAPVRKTSNRIGLRTDSSQRYEKTLDSLLCKRTMFRTLELIIKLCPEASIVGKLEYDGIDLSKIEPLVIDTTVSKINSVLGIEVPKEKITKIFSSLDFKVESKNENDLKVFVPSYRATKDTENEADLIEEIGRMIGFDNIEPTSPLFKLTPVSLSNAKKLERKIKNFFNYTVDAVEIMTYPMVGKKLLKKAEWKGGQELKLINALSEDHDRMRSSLIPGFLQAAALNQKNYSEFRFFELGRSYISDKKDFSSDHTQLGVVFFNKEKSCFMDLVNVMEKFLDNLNIPGNLCEKNPKFNNLVLDENWMGSHPYEFLNIRIMGRMNGVIASIHPLMLSNFKIKGHLSIAIIDLASLENQKLKDATKYRPLSKFPVAEFDCTVVANHDVEVGGIIKVLSKVKVKEIKSVEIVDTYKLNDTQKTITIRTILGDDNKTLSRELLESAQNQIVEKLQAGGFPLKT